MITKNVYTLYKSESKKKLFLLQIRFGSRLQWLQSTLSKETAFNPKPGAAFGKELSAMFIGMAGQ